MELVTKDGKPVKPSVTDRIRAFASGDREATITLTADDVGIIVTNNLWHNNIWLDTNYTHWRGEWNAEAQKFIFTFFKEE